MSELSDRIKNVIENEPVVLFMKGTPQFIMCGNSDRALRALREAGAPVTAVNVLPDPAIRQELQEVSGWRRFRRSSSAASSSAARTSRRSSRRAAS